MMAYKIPKDRLKLGIIKKKIGKKNVYRVVGVYHDKNGNHKDLLKKDSWTTSKESAKWYRDELFKIRPKKYKNMKITKINKILDLDKK